MVYVLFAVDDDREVARSIVATSVDEFAPGEVEGDRAGAGAQGTVRVDSDTDLAHAITVLAATGATSIAVEEFVEGHEGFYDTIAKDNRVVHDWTTHYYPNVLEAMRTRWISPQFITTNRMADSSFYTEVAELGQRVIEALDIGTSATHMEWFHGPPKSVVAHRVSDVGTCMPRATMSTSTASGQTSSPTAHRSTP